MASFYCFLVYDKHEFVVDLDDIWKWIGFTRKDNAKRLLDKYFVENIDFRISLRSEGNSKGRPIEQISLTVNAFKKFCLKADTKKADEIHNYYIKLEELLQETINEETAELRNQLLLKDTNHKTECKKIKHDALMNLMKTKNCVYVGEIEENKLIKIGSSKHVVERLKGLNDDYGNIYFLEVFECERFREVEDAILKDPIIKKNLCKNIVKINGSRSIEVVELTQDFTYDQLLSLVKNHINKSYNAFMSPEQILEMQKIELEKQKLNNDILLAIINNDKYSEDVKKIIGETLSGKISNITAITNASEKQLNNDVEKR